MHTHARPSGSYISPLCRDFVFRRVFGCSDGMESEACVCDHGYERSDLCAEIIIIIICNWGMLRRSRCVLIFLLKNRRHGLRFGVLCCVHC